jgi:hypothetical protein
MVDIVKFGDKVARVCSLHRANNRPAPGGKTQLVEWLGLGGGTLSKRYGDPVAVLQASLERAVVMALGFGPDDSEFEQYPWSDVWSRWAARWGALWRDGDSIAFARHLEETGYFVARMRDDPRLAVLLPKIRRPMRVGGKYLATTLRPVTDVSPVSTTPLPKNALRYLDRLASLQVVHICEGDRRYRLMATCTFGDVEISTEDAVYLVSVNRCRAELFLTAGSLEAELEDELINSWSTPVRQMKVKREFSRRNHPTWILCDDQPKTPLGGEYCELRLGVVIGMMTEADEASLLVHKAEFVVSALSGPVLKEEGILTSLLKYLVTEHVGEIEQTNNYLFRLSPGPIQSGDDR